MKNNLKFLAVYYVFLVSFFSFFVSGIFDSTDGLLYLSVARNMYYKGEAIATPKDESGKNVRLNSVLGEDGKWRSPQALGYSVALIPAVFFSDMLHRAYGTHPPENFPLEHDWSVLFFGSFTNIFFAGMLGVLLYLFAGELGLKRKQAVGFSFFCIIATNLFALATYSFAHMMFITASVGLVYSIRKFIKQNNYLQVFLGLFWTALLVTSYNTVYIFFIIGAIIYGFVLLKPSYRRKLVLPIFMVVFLSLFAMILKYGAYLPYFFGGDALLNGLEGTWGLLLSPGKSIFLYSPPLIAIIVFWHKIKRHMMPELILFLSVSLIFISVYSMLRAEGDPLWDGDLVWGPRYFGVLIPYGMLVVLHIWKHVHRSLLGKTLFAILIVWGIAMQLVGILTLYQLQYRNLPGSVRISGGSLNTTEFAAFIPRFSPLLRMLRETARIIYISPQTLDHGRYNVRFIDGFAYPHYTLDRAMYSQGHILLSNRAKDPINTVTAEFSVTYQEARVNNDAVVIHLNDRAIKTYQISKSGVLNIQLEKNDLKDKMGTGENTLSFIFDQSVLDAQRQVALVQMKINEEVVNTKSVSFPDLSAISRKSAPYQYRYFGSIQKDPWFFWQLRGELQLHTINLWWIRMLYYWDVPKNILFAMLSVFGISLVISSFYTVKYIQNPNPRLRKERTKS